MGNPYVIGVSSQKGGVGKTTISVNLAVVLRSFNYKVLLIDSDTTNPCIGLHMGLEQANIGYMDVLSERADLNDAIAIHGTTGLHVLPGTLSARRLPVHAKVAKFLTDIRKGNYDFVIFDTAPGFVEDDLSRYYDEALILTTPDMPACTSSIRLAQKYDQIGVKHNIVVNRIRNKRYEISVGEIEEIYEKRVRGAIPEDDVVPISVSEHIPAYVISPNSRFSVTVRAIARKYASRDSRLTAGFESSGIMARIVQFLRRLFRPD